MPGYQEVSLVLTALAMIVTTIVVIAFKPFAFVSPGTRQILCHRFRNELVVLDAGFHVYNPLLWSIWTTGPFTGMIGAWASQSPAPGSRVSIDPPKSEVRAKDGVFGTADISIVALVTPWSGEDVLGQNVPFVKTAHLAINQWMSKELSDVMSANLASYSHVTQTLNEPAALERLNQSLRGSMLQAVRVAVDSKGIQLQKTFLDSLDVELSLRRKIELQLLESETAVQQTKQKILVQEMEAQHKRTQTEIMVEIDRITEQAKVEVIAFKVTKLVAAGLSMDHIVNLLCMDNASTALRSAEHVVVGMSPGLLGFRGANHVLEMDSYEKIQ